MSGGQLAEVDHSLMTLRQAAARTGISATTLRRYIRAGRLHARLIPGRYGPEYAVSNEDLTQARLSAAFVAEVSLNEMETGAGLPPLPHSGLVPPPLPDPARQAMRGPLHESSAITPVPPGSLASSVDHVPAMLYRELLMKHEHLLVQFGMLRVSGRQLFEIRQELERKAVVASEAQTELERIRDRHAKEIGLLRSRLRQSELALAERDDEIARLRSELQRGEITRRNASRLHALEDEFRRKLDAAPMALQPGGLANETPPTVELSRGHGKPNLARIEAPPPSHAGPRRPAEH